MTTPPTDSTPLPPTTSPSDPAPLANAFTMTHAEYMAVRYGVGVNGGHQINESWPLQQAQRATAEEAIRRRNAEPPPESLPDALAMSDEDYRRERYGKTY